MAGSGAERHVCPRCHLPAITIVYGLLNALGVDKAHIGRIVSGGCALDPNSPTLTGPTGGG
jgi:hypothetical protein